MFSYKTRKLIAKHEVTWRLTGNAQEDSKARLAAVCSLYKNLAMQTQHMDLSNVEAFFSEDTLVGNRQASGVVGYKVFTIEDAK